jgi:hypothetical protein
MEWMLPRDHVATRSDRYPQPPEAIWKAITDVDRYAVVARGLKGVKKLPGRNELPAHIEVTSVGEIPMETAEMLPPPKLAGRMGTRGSLSAARGPFEIEPVPEGTTLRITERGFVSNPNFRFLSRFVFGYTVSVISWPSGRIESK